MCSPIFSKSSWFLKPIVPAKEACHLAIFTTIALFAIGLATYCYLYGTTPGYNEIYAYCLWGIAGGAILCTLICYLARAILSREFVRQRQEEAIRWKKAAEQEQLERFNYIFEKFFSGSKLENLPTFSTKLSGSTGYFDQNEALKPFFVNGCNVVRAQQANRPFLGIHLAIQYNNDPKISARLLIAPNSRGMWYVNASQSISQHIHPYIYDDSPECHVFINWLDDILKGKERFLLQQDKKMIFNNPNSNLVEKMDGPKVSLWKD